MSTPASSAPKRTPPTVVLRPVTSDNWQAVTRLSVAPGQEDFVANNAYSLAQAAYQGGLTPLAVYATDGSAGGSGGEALVGFAMYSYLPDELGRHWIFRVMFDQSQQGKGYGRATMPLLIADMKANIPNLRTIALDFHEDNHVAEKLYESLGFVKTGEREEHEIVAALDMGG